MGKNIIWYSMDDGSHGGCAATDLLVCDSDDITPEEGIALYDASSNGDDEAIRDAFMQVYYRQNPGEDPRA